MSNRATALRLRGRRDQGNRIYRRIGQLQELERRSDGAFRYIAYDRDEALYQVRVGEHAPLYLRSAEIDPFVAGVEYGLLAMGVLRAPSGKQGAEWYRLTAEEPVARVESVHQLSEPEPTATAHPASAGDDDQAPGGELRVRWPATPHASRYHVEVRDNALRTPQWRIAAVVNDPECTVPVRKCGDQWQVRVRAEDPTGAYAESEWAVASATPTGE